MDILHLNYPLVLFGSKGSASTLPLILLSPRIMMLCHCSSTMTKDHFLVIFMALNVCQCAFKHSFIPAFHKQPAYHIYTSKGGG